MTIGTLLLYKMDFDHEAFYRRAFRTMTDQRTRRLIVDLRGNGGGTTAGIMDLLSYLVDEPIRTAHKQTTRCTSLGDVRPHMSTWQEEALDPPAEMFEPDPDGDGYRLRGPANWVQLKSPRFQGEVVFLSDEANSSAITSFLGIVQDRQIGRIVGGPTGGSKEGPNGDVIFFLSLPASGMTVKIPGVRVHTAVRNFVPGRGVLPDVPVRVSPADLVAGRDPVMERARQLLGES